MSHVGPFFYYLGSKHRLSARLPAPKHDLIVEPFAGSAGYACRYPERDVLLIENSPGLVALWQWLVGVSSDEILALPLPKNGARIAELEVSLNAKRLISMYASVGPQGHARVRSSDVGGGWNARMRDRVARDVQRIRHWKVVLGDYSCAPDVAATWIIDPPYQRVQARYHGGTNASISYRHLAQFALSRSGQVFVHEQHGADWLEFRDFATINSANHSLKAGASAKSREVLWANTPAEVW